MNILFALAHIVMLLLTGGESQDELYREIKLLNEGMEASFEGGDMKGVADFYLDNAVMLAPGQPAVTGREKIDAYWMRTRDPVSWDLEVFVVSRQEEEIYSHELYKELKVKPPSWHETNVLEEVDKEELVYQLGRSSLTSMYNGEKHTSVVTFVLVWRKTADSYRILVDTYAW